MLYKNIIFDLGGVILNINPELAVNAFKKLGFRDFDKIYSQMYQDKIFDKFEKGEISPNKFRHEIKKKSPCLITDLEIDKAWNSLLLDYPKKVIWLLQELKKKYRTFLISNTNVIHYKKYTAILRKEFPLNSLSDLFEKTYYSFNIGMKKPDIKIYQLVLEENNLVPEETFFIDDSEKNIETAMRTGIKTHHLINNNSLLEILNITFS